jgi:hypothetical protein
VTRTRGAEVSTQGSRGSQRASALSALSAISALIIAFTICTGVTVVAQRGAGGRGGAAAARTAAPIDLTGTWVSVVTEDWRWRMVTPPKGDYASVPLNAAATKVADAWDPAKDTAAGEECRAFGAAAIMRMPGRIRISWADDNTMTIETEAGTQTRALQFGASAPAAAPTWQGTSIAVWQPAGGGGNRRGGGPPPRGGSLRVVTTNIRPGYLRKNGVPYSANARLTEYINRTTEPNGDSWLIVTTLVEDPQYLTSRFVTSSHFKKVADGSTWSPTPCSAS